MTERSFFWRRYLEAIVAEGITTAAYARREGLSLGLLYQWRRKLNPAPASLSTSRRAPAPGFVTRKITRALARIKLGLQDCLYLGNLDARRDWGHAKDYVEMQWLMLQQDTPEDFVIATRGQYSVRDFVNAAVDEIGLAIRWSGQGGEEKGFDTQGQCIVAVDPRYFRPTEVETPLGDASKAREKLGWTPRISFEELVAEMMRKDLKAAERDELVKRHGYQAMDYHE